MCLMQFRTTSIDVYKDTLLGQMASSEQAEVWSPWSCWIEQLECVLSSPGGKNSTSQWWKNQTVQQRDGFFKLRGRDIPQS